jgi:hypothetical protein
LLAVIVGVILYIFVVYPLAFIFIFITAMKDCLQSVSTGCDNCPCYRIQVNKYLYDLDKI